MSWRASSCFPFGGTRLEGGVGCAPFDPVTLKREIEAPGFVVYYAAASSIFPDDPEGSQEGEKTARTHAIRVF
jgi:hypothetical protein